MKDNKRWRQLCQLIAVERDPWKLFLLTNQLNQQLTEQDGPKKRPNVRADSVALPKQRKAG
jgi:hypothetical protein